MSGLTTAAPVKAIRLYEMAQFLEKIEYKWTINEYLDTPVGMVQFMRDYWQMTDTPASEPTHG